MNATLLYVVMVVVPGYGEKDVVKRIVDVGGTVCMDGTFVEMPPTSTDADLGELCELRRLTILHLYSTKHTDNGLRTVGGLRRLQVLALSGQDVTDEGLRHLESLTCLELLHLKGCPNITEKGVARLQKVLPKCLIVF
jgi:hypothetical protein